jgi:signal transduction histidine kinase
MQARLRYSYLAGTAILVVLLGLPLVLAYDRSAHEALAAEAWLAADLRAHLAVHAIEDDDLDALQAIADMQVLDAPRVVAIFDAAGEVLVSTATEGLRSPPAATIEAHPDVAAVLRGGPPGGADAAFEAHPGWASFAVPVESGGRILGAVDLAISTSEIDREIAIVGLAAASGGLLALAGAWVLGGRLASWVLRPLRDLETAAAAWACGQLDVRAGLETGPAELQEVGTTFDDMAGRLERLIEAQSSFVADACHELRLPLTIFRLRLGALAHQFDGSARADLLALDEDVGALGGRLDELLLLASTEVRAGAVGIVDAGTAIRARAGFWEPLARDRDVELTCDVPTDPAERTAGELSGVLEEILDNLISNAIYAAAPGGTVTLRITNRDGWVEVHVIDDGSGLDDGQRSRAFDRFWRASSGAGHAGGLGLAIVRRLAEMMGASVELRPAPTGGTDAVVRLHPVGVLADGRDGGGGPVGHDRPVVSTPAEPS